MQIRYCYILLILAVFITACSFNHKKESQQVLSAHSFPVSFAKGFVINLFDDHMELIVRDPIDTDKIMQTWYLYSGALPENSDHDAAFNVHIPISDIACLSTTHLGFLEALHLQDKLIAFSGNKYVYDSLFRIMIANKEIAEIGEEGSLNDELLVSLQPDIVMAYQIGNEDYDHFQKLKSLHLKPVLNNEYLELTPLGQAEWIKFVAAFFGKLDVAAKQFDSITVAYLSVQQMVAKVSNRPTVFTGMAFKGEWTIPGGASFAANYLKDSGADFIWSEDERTGNYPVALEEVIAKAQHADFWLHAGAASTMQSIKENDIRFTYLDAFQTNAVYNNNKRVNENGGNDYWESGIVSPQIILMDLVKIFHPELLVDHQTVYYNQLH